MALTRVCTVGATVWGRGSKSAYVGSCLGIATRYRKIVAIAGDLSMFRCRIVGIDQRRGAWRGSAGKDRRHPLVRGTVDGGF